MHRSTWFLIGLAFVVVCPWPSLEGATPPASTDPCLCKLAAPETQTELPPSPYCSAPVTVSVEQYATSSSGLCINGDDCTVGVDCKVDANIRVQSSSPCRIGFKRDDVYVGGGVADVDIAIVRTFECGDFEEVEITLGGITVNSVNFWCQNCSG